MRLRRQKRTASSALVVLALTMILGACLNQDVQARVRRVRHHTGDGRFSQRGLAVGMGLGSVGLETNLPGFGVDKSGPGVVLGLSCGLSDQVTLFGTLTVSGFETDGYDDRSAGYGDLGVKFSLVSNGRQRTQPYVSAALGRAAYNDGQGREYEGGALRLAGGIDHFITRHAILFIEAGFWSGQFEQVRLDEHDYQLVDEPEFTSAAMMVGLRFKL